MKLWAIYLHVIKGLSTREIARQIKPKVSHVTIQNWITEFEYKTFKGLDDEKLYELYITQFVGVVDRKDWRYTQVSLESLKESQRYRIFEQVNHMFSFIDKEIHEITFKEKLCKQVFNEDWLIGLQIYMELFPDKFKR